MGFTKQSPSYINNTDGTSIINVNDWTSVNTLTVDSTTPSVSGSVYWKTANTVATTISNFTKGSGIAGLSSSQKIIVYIGDNNTTIDFTGTNLKGNDGVDWSPALGDWMECYQYSNSWYCDVHTIHTAQTYTETNITPDRAFDADKVAVAELADIVGTLIVDLRARGIVK